MTTREHVCDGAEAPTDTALPLLAPLTLTLSPLRGARGRVAAGGAYDRPLSRLRRERVGVRVGVRGEAVRQTVDARGENF